MLYLKKWGQKEQKLTKNTGFGLDAPFMHLFFQWLQLVSVFFEGSLASAQNLKAKPKSLIKKLKLMKG